MALGYSSFCELFTEEEWKGYEYASSLYFYYTSGFGCPVGRSLGTGYVQELLARLTHTPISRHKSSTNSTLDDDPVAFPLDQKIYVDASHDDSIMNVLTALGLEVLHEGGPLHPFEIPKHQRFSTSKIVPFASNVQFQGAPSASHLLCHFL